MYNGEAIMQLKLGYKTTKTAHNVGETQQNALDLKTLIKILNMRIFFSHNLGKMQFGISSSQQA